MKCVKPSHCADCPAPIEQTKHGHRLYCDACRTTRTMLLASAWYVENRQHDPAWAEKNKARAKRWREENADRVKARNDARRKPLQGRAEQSAAA